MANMLLAPRTRARSLTRIAYWSDDDDTQITGKRRSRAKAAERRKVRRSEDREWRRDVA